MIRLLITAFALGLHAAASAQIFNPPVATVPPQLTQEVARVSSRVDDIVPLLCPPGSSAPRMEAVNGSAGSAVTCRRTDDVQPRISRTATCTIPTGGRSCVGTWEGAPFPSGTDIRLTGDPAPINAAASQPIQCNASALTMSTITVYCWVAQTSVVSILGATIVPFSTSVAGTVVQATAIPKS